MSAAKARPGQDTIAAIATPAGIGGVGIVRVSGPDAVTIVAAVIGRPVARLADRRLVHAVARDGEGGRIDDVLAVAMRGPRSFTGEDVAELHGHGGAVNVGRLLRVVLARGARLAEPGEFTRRAFENERIDLTRAEAIAGVIEATGERALRLAQAQLAGQLGAAIDALRTDATAVLAEIEAGIDFPEEGLALAVNNGSRLAARAALLAERCRRLAAGFARGQAIRDGIDVAIIGVANVGKSSLFNSLLGKERALVAAEPGTTRDFVEASAVWDGVRVTLIDTAGARAPSDPEASAAPREWPPKSRAALSTDATARLGLDPVEQRGIELGLARAREADLRVLVMDARSVGAASASPGSEVWSALGAGRILRVASKVDALAAGCILPADIVATSAVTGLGIEALRTAIVTMVVGGEAESEDGVLVTTERQHGMLTAAAAALEIASSGLAQGQPGEIVAIELRTASRAFASLLGSEVEDEVLDELFRRFCIGK